ncbi:hypothetical protein KFL_000140320 [Klebsormidium nitens]|uniref:Transmembrane protein adipocyte-associated 1 n=1 Tax=Klebsormidium nitens TaxID=105231 RepID=A0A1Y1HLH7_KLENI|nr:hypothetical protein KFL_000140320 [Klebsormidium nitens]|eukprot:GAQ78512.1 hypothetical protein KFL_000140320 [Klebsormidium nitens]
MEARAMQGWQEAEPGPSPYSTSPPFCLALVSPHTQHFNVIFYDLAVGLPTIVFVAYLLTKVKGSVRKLVSSRSHIMSTYYGFLWIVCALNILRVLVQIFDAEPADSPRAWNVTWLITRFGMVLLEVSVVVFLSQGYLISGWEALIRTVAFSGVFAIVDTVIKAIYVFGLGVPLFITEPDDEGNWRKWSFWMLHALLFLGIYALILVLPHTRWRDRLPARPAFYRYVFVLFLINIGLTFGSFLLGLAVDFGYCLYGFSSFLYYAFYPPLLYITFLADFFREEDLQMEDVYYSEMKDAGYFDADWE